MSPPKARHALERTITTSAEPRALERSPNTTAGGLLERIFRPLGLDMQLHPALTEPDVAIGYWTVNGESTALHPQRR